MDRKLAEKQLETLAPSRAKTRAPPPPRHLSAGLADPQHLSFEAVGALQRLAGNAAVAELLAPSAAGAEKDEKQKKSGIGEQAAAAASESSSSTLGPLEQVLGPAP